MNIKAPKDVVTLLDVVIDRVKGLLGRNLIGIYLHGSLAMNCFNPLSSDIDLLIVVRDKLSPGIRQALVTIMIELTPKAPPKGFEISVITLDELHHFKHPMPFELHFSNYWLKDYQAGKVDLSDNADRVDNDLAAHLTTTRARGVALYGAPIDAVFPEISEELYRKSIIGDAKEILANMMSDPVYNVLNLCRVMAFIDSGLVMSKLEGGEWALGVVGESQARIIRQALDEYEGKGKRAWDAGELKQFGDAMAHTLFP